MNLYDSHIDAGQELCPKDKAAYYTALIEYVCYGIEPEKLTGPAKAIFVAIKPTLDMSRTKSAAGKAGGEANAKQMASRTGSKTEAEGQANGKQNGEQTPSKDGSKTEAKNKNKYKNNINPQEVVKTTTSYPFGIEVPTVEMVKAYAVSQGCPDFDADAFVTYFEGVGWKVRGEPIFDWTSVCHKWLRDSVKMGKVRKEEKDGSGWVDGSYIIPEWDELAS